MRLHFISPSALRAPEGHVSAWRGPFASLHRGAVLGAGLCAALAIGIARPAHAQDDQDSVPSAGVQLGLNYALGSKPGVLVLPASAAHGDSIRAIIQRDLDFDDRATVVALDETAAQGMIPKAGGKFNFPVIAKLGVVALIYPRITDAGLSVSMYDVAAKKLSRKMTVTLPSDVNSPEWRMALHKVSDQVGKWIFGSPGAAETRIAYSYAGHIWQIDYDGTNPRKLTSGQDDMSPAWYPDAQKIVFSGRTDGGWQIATYNFVTGETHWKSSTLRGLNLTPVVSPDGHTIAYSNGREVGTDLVVADVDDEKSARRITVGRGSDNTSPSFSPDGRQITFMSGRLGHPEIYIMDADGTNAHVLTEFTYGEQAYRASPDWSPDGRMIAYESRISGDFQIMTIDLRDGTTKQYTSDGVNEDPSWAPDSRHVVFSSTRSGVRQLWVADVESGRLRQVTRQSGARLPAWSPMLNP